MGDYTGAHIVIAIDGGDGRAAPGWGGNELKKTGAYIARARTRGQTPLV